MYIKKQVFYKNVLPLLLAFLGAAVFFVSYNNYLLDKTLANLRVSLKRLDVDRSPEIARSVREILDDTFIMEVARKDLDAATLAKIEFSSQIVTKVSEGAEDILLEDAVDFLQDIIAKRQQQRSPFLNTLDTVLTNLNPRQREANKNAIEAEIRQRKQRLGRYQGEQLQKEYLELARLYVTLKEWDEALYHLNKVETIDATSMTAKEALFYAGIVHKFTGNYAQAKDLFQEVKDELAGELGALSYFEEGDALYRMGDIDAATRVFEEAFKKNPELEVAQIAQFRAGYIKIYDLGRVKTFDEAFARTPFLSLHKLADFKAGDIIDFYNLDEEADLRDSFLSLSQVAPDSKIVPGIARAYRNRGFALARQGYNLSRQGRYTEATGRFIFSEEQFNLALEVEKKDALSLSGKSIALLYLKNQEEALKVARAARQLAPDNPIVVANSGFIYAELQMFDEAIEEYKYALRLSPHSSVLNYNLGTLYLLKGKLQAGTDYLKKAQLLDPNLVSAHNNLGYIYWQEKRFQEAKIAFEKGISIQQDYVEGRYNLGALLFSLERYDEARKHFLKVKQLQSTYRKTDWFLEQISKLERSMGFDDYD